MCIIWWLYSNITVIQSMLFVSDILWKILPYLVRMRVGDKDIWLSQWIIWLVKNDENVPVRNHCSINVIITHQATVSYVFFFNWHWSPAYHPQSVQPPLVTVCYHIINQLHLFPRKSHQWFHFFYLV